MRRTVGKILLTVGTWLFPLTAFADGGNVELSNPLGENDVRVILVRILRYSLGLIGIVALIMIIYGGFLMLTSGGNADTIKKAKSTIVWAAAGVAIVLGSWQILRFIFETVNEVTK